MKIPIILVLNKSDIADTIKEWIQDYEKFEVFIQNNIVL